MFLVTPVLLLLLVLLQQQGINEMGVPSALPLNRGENPPVLNIYWPVDQSGASTAR